MSALSEERLAALLDPYLLAPVMPEANSLVRAATQVPAVELYPKLSRYLDLLLQWNTRTNLTAVRDPESIVQRHFGESLFAGRFLGSRLSDGDSVLDFGSGAGFPGLPIQLLLPGLNVTLAESQGKKVAFLREAIRSLGISVEVWAGRVERLPVDRKFSAVTMRAVDHPEVASEAARDRVRSEGWLLELAGTRAQSSMDLKLPGTKSGVLHWERIGRSG